MAGFSDVLLSLNFREIQQVLINNAYYDLFFPLLLVYAVLFSVLSSLDFFKSKKTGKTYSSVVFIISILVSWYGVTFELSPGRSVGYLIKALFPNISALTILILVFYLVGSVLGKDFFGGVFSRSHTSYLYIALGVIGLSSVLFYTGIAMGFWNYDIFDLSSYWNFVFAVAFLILGVVFLFIDLIAYGVILLIIVFVFISDGGSGNILEYFIDPVIFIISLFIFLFSWVSSGSSKDREVLAEKLRSGEESLAKYSSEIKDYDDRIRDIIKDNYEANKKLWKERYGDESWK